jgi:predicted phage terminase large subunit-like protein
MPDAHLQLSTTQAAFVQDAHRYSAFVGGIGSGKTFAGGAKAEVQELGQPGLGLVVAPSYRMLLDATWRTALEVWAPLVSAVYRAEMRLSLSTGAEVLFRSADDPNKLRGPSASWAWIDEGAQCDPETWPIVIGRLREGGRAGRCWVTTTPSGLDNWVYQTFVVNANADTALYQASTDSNPFVDPAYVAALRAQYPSQFARQELDGEFVVLGGGVLRREWFRVVEAAPDGLTWCRYWDLATSTRTAADFTASVRAARGADGTLYLADGIHLKAEWPDVRRAVLQTLALEPGVAVGIEQAGYQLAAVQDLLREPATFGRTLKGVTVDRDKLSRATPWIARAEAGKVALVRGAWCADFLSEATAFPEGGHDDYIDAVSGAAAMLSAPVGRPFAAAVSGPRNTYSVAPANARDLGANYPGPPDPSWR